FSGFERLHLRRVGAPFIIIIHSGADAITDQAADRRARQTGGDALAGSATELRTDQAAGNRADERARVFLRSLAGLGSTGARRHRKRDERGSKQANERHVSSPQMIRSTK